MTERWPGEAANCQKVDSQSQASVMLQIWVLAAVLGFGLLLIICVVVMITFVLCTYTSSYNDRLPVRHKVESKLPKQKIVHLF